MRQSLSRTSRVRAPFALAGFTPLALAVARPGSAVVFDLDGDGKSDIVVRNAATGVNRVLFMNGATVTSDAPTAPLNDREFTMAALADFNLDNRADLFWYHQSSGERLVWFMNGVTQSGTQSLGQQVDTDWRIAGAGKFGGDGRADLLWRHEATGDNVLWVMTATSPQPIVLQPEVDLGWRVSGIADANGDGISDIYWRHRDGRNRIWLMASGAFSQSINLPSRDPLWQVVGVGDFDGNGVSDILWRHPVSGKATIWFMSGSTITKKSDELFVTLGGEWQPEMVADYNGDLKSDILWRNAATGQMQVWLMNGAVKTASGLITSAGPGFALAGKPQPPAAASVFLATLTPEAAASTPASGSSTIVLAPDGQSAKITLNFTNLTTTQTAAHVHGPADPGTSAPPLYSVPMGSFSDVNWVFEPTAGLTLADQVDALKTGRLYINVHSANYPNGEIRGQYRLTSTGGIEPSIPNPPPPGLPTAARAHRFLQQCTMGATPALVSLVQSIGFDAFLEQQFAAPPSTYTAFVDAASTTNDTDRLGAFRSRFFMNALAGQDQLRQRVAFALSQLVVVSTNDISNGPGMARYADKLSANAFGSFYNVLVQTTLDPVMGNYLDMANNDKPNLATGRTANENYARELMQLFSIGLYKTWPNGSLKLDAVGAPIPTYDQDVIENMARVMTGFTYSPSGTNPPAFNRPVNYLGPLVLSQANHDIGQKTIFDGITLPAGRTGYEDLGDTITALFNHPNAGVFVARTLIQQLVTSNPSKGYIARVARVFDSDSNGSRGNLQAVVKAILLDVEARRDPIGDDRFGKQTEPVLFLTSVVRGLGATGQGYGLAERTATLSQQVYGSPTVFNFYQPDFQVPGTTLLGPPFQIYVESTAVGRANLANTLVYSTIGRPNYAPAAATTVAFNFAPWIASAGNPGGLVDALADLLMPGRMSPAMRTTIVNAVTATPATDPTNRARTAIYLMVTSPTYNVGR